MKSRELIQMGIPPGECKRLAIVAVAEAAKAGHNKSAIKAQVQKVIEAPQTMLEDPIFGELGSKIGAAREARARYEEREEPAPKKVWGGGSRSNVAPADGQRLPVAGVGAGGAHARCACGLWPAG